MVLTRGRSNSAPQASKQSSTQSTRTRPRRTTPSKYADYVDDKDDEIVDSEDDKEDDGICSGKEERDVKEVDSSSDEEFTSEEEEESEDSINNEEEVLDDEDEVEQPKYSHKRKGSYSESYHTHKKRRKSERELRALYRSTEEFFNSPKNLELLSREREDSVDRNDRDEKDEKDGNKKYSLRSNSNGKQKDGIVVVEIEPSRPGLRTRKYQMSSSDKRLENGNQANKTHIPEQILQLGRRRRLRKEVTRFTPASSTTRSWNFRRRHRKHHYDSSSDSSSDAYSSSSSSSEEEDTTYKSKKASLTPTPINMDPKLKNKNKMRADIDPMTIDTTVNFDSIGGLDHHIRALKEMVTFPLLYPEVFERFGIAPPKGVLFYGPPGTGKTLVARALANTCTQSGQKISFFMRKGADCLSKWVGEAERQLRLLFQQAYLMQPSIIFFDEIDGLAPVRSSKQDQIHSSIVSTLLALMDGLDSRGQIVVIGATNRIDSIDPALRRPGRFDREFLFTLPTKEARRAIFSIHTKNWNPPLSEDVKHEIADSCVGYCGADIKALCSEAALRALRRRYPQIYQSTDRLLIDVSSIRVTKKDFFRAMREIVPSAHRTSATYAKSLNSIVSPLLSESLEKLKQMLEKIFPFRRGEAAEDSGYEDDEVDNNTLSTLLSKKNPRNTFPVFRPRILLYGKSGMGQSEIGGALLYLLEEFPVSAIDIATLFSNPATKTLEESFIVSFREALRKIPSVVYLPHIDSWWKSAEQSLRTTLINMIQDVDPSLPLLLLAISDVPHSELPRDLVSLFSDTFELLPPDENARREFFSSVVRDMAHVEKPQSDANQVLEELPKAPPPPPRVMSESERKKQQEDTLRSLRHFLRKKCIQKLQREKKYHIFFKPVNAEQYPDYYEIIKNPMDLQKVTDKLADKVYTTLNAFLEDINLIVSNAIEYNPESDPMKIATRAKELEDDVQRYVSKLDPDLIAACEKITEEMKEKKSNRNRSNSSSPESRNSSRSKEPEEELEMTPFTIDASIVQKPSKSADAPAAQVVQKPVELAPPPPLIFDQNAGHKIQEELIRKTNDYSIEKLLQLHSKVYKSIHAHRYENDKTALLAELESILKELY